MAPRSETANRATPELSGSSCPTRWAHTLQLLLAIVALGLDVYGVRLIAYNALIYSLIVAACTIPVCIYLIVAQSYIGRLSSPYIAAAYHACMLIFWIIDLGLSANFVKLWASPECDYDSTKGYLCVPFENHGLGDMELHTYNTYHGVIVAGAVLAGIQLALWILTSSALIFNIKHRLAKPVQLQKPSMQQSNTLHHASIPFQEIHNTTYTEVFHIAAPSDSWAWDRPRTPLESRQPIIPDPVTTDEGPSAHPSQDIPREPLARLAFGAPEPSTRESSMDVVRQQSSASRKYRQVGKRVGPGDIQQIDWEEGESLDRVDRDEVSVGEMSEGRVRRLTMGELQIDV